MIETLKKEWQAKIALILFLLLTVWWVYVQIKGHPGSNQNQLFAAVYGIMAAWGAIWGLKISKGWGGLKSVMGKAIIFFSLGLCFQEFGQLSYSFYIYYKHIDVPYPSIGDIGYFGSIPLYILGVLYLAKASGVRVSLKSLRSKIQAVVVPLIVLSLGYYLFLQGYVFDWTHKLTIFLDFGYPLGEAAYVSLALLVYLLSRNLLGGIMKNKILFILFALFVQFLSDYTFLYQASKKTWYAGGLNDFSYLIAYFLMTLGLLQLHTTIKNLRKAD